MFNIPKSKFNITNFDSFVFDLVCVIAQRARVMRDHGMSKDRRYWHDFVGYNYRLTNIQAAIGVAQMEKFQKILEKK